MAFNLVDTVSGLFTNNLTGNTASSLGESEGGIQKAIGGIVPSILVGLLNNAGSGSYSADSIYNMAKEASGSGILGNLGSLFRGGGGTGGGIPGLSNMAGSLFGDKLDKITSLISNFAGIKSSSASSLLNMAVPATFGVIGKHASENNQNAGGLVSMLASQKDNILRAIPSGLGLASALGLGSLSDIGTKLTGTISGVAGEAKKSTRWVLPLLLAVVAIGLLWYLMRGCGNDTKQAENITPTPIDTIEETRTPTVTTPSIKVKLPDGTELDAMRGGIEDNLVAFLNDANAKPGKDVWFDFDNLNFETNSATITAESQKQVNNIAAILKTFPKTKIKIGGYTDKTGDAATNKKLSQDRAEAVVAGLKAAGTNASQLLGAEGYGSEFAKVSAEASEEERRKDRRIAVSVREN